NEYLSSTPQYNLLYDFFGWERPQYIHLAPIMRDHEHKLSKRYGDANFEDFVAKGYLPEAIVNYIALLGWSPKGNQEKLSLDDLKEQFDISGLSQSPSIFDPLKMRWLNSEYVRALDPAEFARLARPFFEKSKAFGRYDEDLVYRLLQPRLEALGDIPEMIDFLEEWEGYDLELFVHQKNKTDKALAKDILAKALPVLKDTPWDNDAILAACTELATDLGVKKGAVLWCVRIAIAGRAVTPGGASEMAVLIGKEESLRRIEGSIARLG
ncbi:MAG: glutamate--tRNA ligase, partial [Clostridia bacterium]|nr:glutamate--tRNA ligase [Clostridia bacterium]